MSTIIARPVKILAAFACTCLCALAFGTLSAQAYEAVVAPTEGASAEIKELLANGGYAGTAAPSADNPFVLKLERGTYTINAQLRVYSYTTFDLGGATLKSNTTANLIRFGDNTGKSATTKGYNGETNITIKNGTIDGNYKDAALVHFSHCQNVSFENVTFKNVKNSHHVEAAGCKNLMFKNCTFTGYKTTKSDPNDEALQFDVLVKGHFSDGAFDETPCQNVTVTGCKFNDVRRGLGTHSNIVASYHTNMKFTNNTFTNIPGYAIICANYRNSTISNNTISNCSAGIIFRTVGTTFYPSKIGRKYTKLSSNSTISGNKITVTNKKYSVTSYGIQIYGEKLKKKNKNGVAAGDYRISGVTASGNIIDLRDSGYGIWPQGAQNSTITNNTILVNTPANGDGKGQCDGMRLVESKGIKITNNSITHGKKNKRCKTACGIVVTDKSSATITGNTIYKPHSDGIRVANKSSATCKSNTIKKYKRYGIHSSTKSKVKAKAKKFHNKVSGKKAKRYHKGGGAKLK